ncbi:2'-5' RNA ligase family protein [Saccharopolyspora sp. NPDC002686]|uniref:2'-5' RNA ligase family protein n=1 Tax=Saccharopolyspora sp. NPDC002686 TaxID=3154541 RepID=UPI00332E2F80
MPEDGVTALVVPLPEADRLLAAVAARFPDAVRPVPAHVSLLYPFVPAEALDERVLAALAEVFAGQPRFGVELGECRRAGGFVSLRPTPEDGFTALSGRIRRRWPDLLPYGGRFGSDVEPHLTVALNTSDETAAAVEREIVPEFAPIRAEVGEAWLIGFQGGWELRRRFDFTG